MSGKTTKIEKAAARMRKLEEQRRRAAEQQRKQQAEVEQLCGQALIDAATGGSDYGDFATRTVAELAAHLGIIDPIDEDGGDGRDGDADDGRDDGGTYVPEVDYDGAPVTEY